MKSTICTHNVYSSAWPGSFLFELVQEYRRMH
nr:MAG TPA: hypothetical protein [Caudoviricetes sp.]